MDGRRLLRLAKAALNSLTANLAAELGARNIRVNAIAPGPDRHDATREVVPEAFLQPIVAARWPSSASGSPTTWSGPLLFLLSDEARWVTGQILAVDGGQIVRI